MSLLGALIRRAKPLALSPEVAGWAPPPMEADPGGGDPLLAELLPLAPGRRCLLAWGDGPRVARMSVALHAAGAAGTLVAHGGEVPGEATRELLDAGRELGLEAAARELLRRAPVPARGAPVAGAVDCDAGRPWRLGAELGSGALAETAGRVDVVADGSQLIHWPEPLARLRALAATGARHVVIETPLLEEDEGLAAAGWTSGAVWHAVRLSPAQSLAVADYWRRRDVSLRQYELMPQGFDAAAARAAGMEATAWWNFTDLAGVERLLREAGLRLLRRRPAWDGRAAVLVAEAA